MSCGDKYCGEKLNDKNPCLPRSMRGLARKNPYGIIRGLTVARKSIARKRRKWKIKVTQTDT